MAKIENLYFTNSDYRETECHRKNVETDLMKLYMNLTHLTIYISFRLDLMCYSIFAVTKPQKSHTVDTWRQSALKSQNPLSLNYNISAVFAPILLQKPSFESSFCPRSIIMQYFLPVVFLLHKIFLYVDRILVYLRRYI